MPLKTDYDYALVHNLPPLYPLHVAGQCHNRDD